MELVDIREILANYENKIIWGLLQRSKYPNHPSIYKTNSTDSIFSQLLGDFEKIGDKYGKYSGPEELPFTEIIKDNPNTIFNYHKHPYNKLLESDHQHINDNPIILSVYQELILPSICLDKTNTNKISLENLVTSDIQLLQIISTRCHLGKIVASIKFKNNPQAYQNCQSDAEIYQLLTNTQVETNILDRIQKKLDIFNQLDTNHHLNKSNLKHIFIKIMDLTKLIQVKYLNLLLNR